MIKMQLCIDQGRPSHPKFYTFLNCTFRYKIFLIFKRKKKNFTSPQRNIFSSNNSKNKMLT